MDDIPGDATTTAVIEVGEVFSNELTYPDADWIRVDLVADEVVEFTLDLVGTDRDYDLTFTLVDADGNRLAGNPAGLTTDFEQDINDFYFQAEEDMTAYLTVFNAEYTSVGYDVSFDAVSGSYLQVYENTYHDVPDNAVLTGNIFDDTGQGRGIAGPDFEVSITNPFYEPVGDGYRLPSGAILTIDDNGDFTYDARGVYDRVTDGEIVYDTFTYYITNGEQESGGYIALAIDVTSSVIAADDAFAIDESTVLTGDLTADNGDGPDTSELDPGTITAIDGVALPADGIVELASGAVLTVEEDGTFTYDPAGLRLLGGQIFDETFTYDITNGEDTDRGEVEIAVTGFDGDDLFSASYPGANEVSGGIGNDTLRGYYGDDTLSGDAGDDQIFGGTGSDSLSGGDGDDLAYGGYGSDAISGGDGADELHGNSGNDTITGGAGDDTVTGDEGDDVIDGDAGDDLLNGGVGNDIISGDAGADTVIGRGGNDETSGGDGDDLLLGQRDADVLDGGAGEDRIVGGLGDDTMTGGTDSDTFVVWSGSGSDTITDFEAGAAAGDTLLLLGFGITFDDLEAGGGIVQHGADTLIDLGEAGQILLLDTTAATLGADDILFG